MTIQFTNNTEWPGIALHPTSFASPEQSEVTMRVYQESRRHADNLNAMANEVPDYLRPHSDSVTGQHVALPDVLGESFPIKNSLLARTAVRAYDQSPIALAQLATILKTAIAGDRQDWPDEEAAGVGLQLMVVAWRVEGLEPAIWRYEPETHELSYVGRAPSAEEADSLTLQYEFSAAPVIVFITGNLAAACARYGSWGHRQLLLRTGAAGQRLWLSSIGVGLAGTVFAGFLPRAANRFAGLDGYLQASLLAFAVGNYPRFAQRLVNTEESLSSTETGQ